jgi:Flp pilus assembly protein protease CpaA
MIEASLFIAVVIIAVTQLAKDIFPKIVNAWIILAAIVIGIVIALIDTHIGIGDITIAQGVLAGLSAVGIHTVASKVGGSSE